MADLPEPPPSIFALSTRATRGFEEELGVFLRATRLRWAETEEGDREALLRDASDELMSRFHGELEELARLKLGALPSREHYPVSEGSFVDGFYMKVLRNPERLLGVDVEDGTVDVHRRVFLGGFYQAMGRAVVDRGRRERVAARKGQDERLRPMLRDLDHDLDQRAEGRNNAEAAAHEFEEERELVLQKLEASSPRQAEIARMKILGDPTAPMGSAEFSSMPEADIAATLGVSVRLVQKEWRAAKAWIAGELRDRGYL